MLLLQNTLEKISPLIHALSGRPSDWRRVRTVEAKYWLPIVAPSLSFTGIVSFQPVAVVSPVVLVV